MDKMKMETPNLAQENLEKLKQMFPEVFTETTDENGEITTAVDAHKLCQVLSTKVIEGDESYDFTWVGKKNAVAEVGRPIRKTLKPCKEESKNWEKTENLYIEGDNLEVLKLLQVSYLNKVKMIYIDPPYNTGNDSFIYPDDYAENKDQYDEEIGAVDENGYRMFHNAETNGRFHSSWCSMMYSRIKLARNLLTNDGVIFISIDDNELDNLKKICSEIFGEKNFVSQLIWQDKYTTTNDKQGISSQTDFILCYAKNIQNIKVNKLPLREEYIKEAYKNPDNDPNGPYMTVQMYKKKNPYSFEVTSPTGKTWNMPWNFTKESFAQLNREGKIFWGADGNACPRKKVYLKDAQGINPVNLLLGKDVGYSGDGGNEVEKLFGNRNVFSYPKNTRLMKHLLKIISDKDSLVLDFFAGAATTAHAVMQLNAEDGGKRKFIMVQLPEICDEKSEAYKAGYKNIAEIGAERIRRAGEKIVKETGKSDLDTGFRVFKVDETYMNDVYFKPSDYKQSMLEKMSENIKPDKNPDDLLYSCMLEWGLELSLPHVVEKIDGFNVHIVNNGDLIACFDKNITEDVIKKIADKKPLRVIFRDSSFKTDADKINVEQIFKQKCNWDDEQARKAIKVL